MIPICRHRCRMGLNMFMNRTLYRLASTSRYGIIVLCLVAMYLVYAMLNDNNYTGTANLKQNMFIHSIDDIQQPDSHHMKDLEKLPLEKSLAVLLQQGQTGQLTERNLILALAKRLVKKDEKNNAVEGQHFGKGDDEEEEDDLDLVDPKQNNAVEGQHFGRGDDEEEEGDPDLVDPKQNNAVEGQHFGKGDDEEEEDDPDLIDPKQNNAVEGQHFGRGDDEEEEGDPDLVDPKQATHQEKEYEKPVQKQAKIRTVVKKSPQVQRMKAVSVIQQGKRRGGRLKELKTLKYNTPKKTKARRLPHCIIVGVKKCGTYALRNFLAQHPNVVSHKLETHFFDRAHILIQGLEKYRRMMPISWPNQTTVEGSPSYFVTPGVPELMFSMNSSLKILLVVRDPTERAISDYLHSKSFGEDRSGLPFEAQAINRLTGEVNHSYQAIDRSMYAIHLPRWLAVFPRSQIHVVSGENLVNNPVQELEKVEEFLNLPHYLNSSRFIKDPTSGFYCMKTASGEEQCLPKAKGRAHPEVDQIVVEKLHKFFKPYNEKFFKMVGQRFFWEE